MALFDTWSDANKQTDSALSSTYTCERDAYVPGRWGGTYWWKITRRRTKSYRYVGMTEAAAKACVQAKLQQYCRSFVSWLWANGTWTVLNNIDDRYCDQVAEVSAEHTEGKMWSVKIDVDEICIAYYHYGSADAIDNWTALEHIVNDYCNTSDWSYDE